MKVLCVYVSVFLLCKVSLEGPLVSPYIAAFLYLSLPIDPCSMLFFGGPQHSYCTKYKLVIFTNKKLRVYINNQGNSKI